MQVLYHAFNDGLLLFAEAEFFFFSSVLVMEKTSNITQPAFSCSKLTTETLKQGVKYVQS